MAKQYSADEKKTLLQKILEARRKHASLNISQICSMYGISSATYYKWRKQERTYSLDPISRKPKKFGNMIEESIVASVIDLWKMNPQLSTHRIYKLCLANGYQISYNTVNKIINFQEEQLRCELRSNSIEELL